MDDDQVSRTIEAFEQELVRDAIADAEDGLAQDDPVFAKRFRAEQRRDGVVSVWVFALLAFGAVLLTVGLATLSWPAWGGGMLALLGAVVLDGHHRRMLERTH